MRIWIVNHYLAPPNRAGNTRHHHLAKALIRRGHEVLLIGASHHHLQFEGPAARTSGTGQEYTDGVQYLWIRTPKRGVRRWSRLWSMFCFAAGVFLHLRRRAPLRPDIVIGSTPHPFGAFTAERVAHHLSVPFVYEIRDLWPITVQELGGYGARHPIIWIMSRLNRHLLKRAVLVVSVMSQAAEYFRSEQLPVRRIACIPNGVDVELVRRAPPRSAPNHRFEVVYAGNHGLANALDSILACARLLQQRGENDFLFRFIGQGTDKPRLEAEAARLELNNVVFDPPVPKTAVFEHLAAADVLIATLRRAGFYKYGMSLNKVFDYLAAAKPIVFGGESPNNPIREADAGIVVAAEDPEGMAGALLEIRRMTPQQRAEMGRRGREYAFRHCSYENRAAQLEEEISAALEALAEP